MVPALMKLRIIKEQQTEDQMITQTYKIGTLIATVAGGCVVFREHTSSGVRESVLMSVIISVES